MSYKSYKSYIGSASKMGGLKQRKRRAPSGIKRPACVAGASAALFFILCFSSFAAPGRADYTNFTIIPERNIFNTKRSPAYKPSNKPTRTVRNEYVALTGTMLDEKGSFAFFDGSQSDYRKVLKPNDAIAGFQVEDIEHAYVKLKHGTNEMILPVNKQLAREEQGEWQLTDRSESRSADVTQGSSASSDSNSRDRRDRRGGNDSGRSNRNSGSAPSNVSSAAQPEQPAATETASGPNSGPPTANAGGPQTEADVLKAMEERRKREDQ